MNILYADHSYTIPAEGMHYRLLRIKTPANTDQQKNAKRAARAIISKLKRLKNAPTSSVDDNTEDDE